MDTSVIHGPTGGCEQKIDQHFPVAIMFRLMRRQGWAVVLFEQTFLCPEVFVSKTGQVIEHRMKFLDGCRRIVLQASTRTVAKADQTLMLQIHQCIPDAQGIRPDR